MNEEKKFRVKLWVIHKNHIKHLWDYNSSHNFFFRLNLLKMFEFRITFLMLNKTWERKGFFRIFFSYFLAEKIWLYCMFHKWYTNVKKTYRNLMCKHGYVSEEEEQKKFFSLLSSYKLSSYLCFKYFLFLFAVLWQ